MEQFLNVQQDDIFKATGYLLKFAEPLVGISAAHEKAIDAFVTEMAKSYPYRQCRDSLSSLAFQNETISEFYIYNRPTAAASGTLWEHIP